ncbi:MULTISPECIES: aminotransferase class V-fold PLP-dependent enzyme [Rhodococcus]|uniref:Aminotransferase class V-fold PLP-dependent enzyme n=3 Tax=Rhodococcus opacus TaxID=37919 RepID=A0AAX3YFB7_RHOOP|nr:aminotransferase class V-fold PLP-dependent enzyme [Rhodococcus opacus]NHU43263.1 aminotransferase class V-fold PLP-dependent enzyme [Rhodococcus sp. A14]MBA8958238.1 selenocysteine lyase/cysteine desulfurase [Rhodococcus opacus]MBP2203803.1 selenocysteine lyase/cysteine desulfurase [Rhodococcus opacus]MCZ4589030.1 aminotransferase class V-fold PLP-dependent enzyme [Rhodococcus opacus]MDJ0419472.1 aminotransferase class V-fold PLP-dependent enzyme [Rhodococcus opacus]
MTAVLTADVCVAPLAQVSGSDLRVPLVQGGDCAYVNFDYAASAPALAQVTDRIGALLPTYSSVHRGAGYASRVSTECYEKARDSVARFVGAGEDQVVVFTRNTTDSLNLLAGCVPGSTVVLDIEHHANLLPWKNSRVVQAADTLDETVRLLVAELCSKPTALLAVTGASNVTGEVLPIAALAEVAHRCGARILVDAAQLAPHRRIDVEEWGVDYLAFSGHKLYAPFGAGVLVGRRDWLDAAEPYLAGGGAVRNVTVESTQWAPAPARHEAGTPNVLGAAALAAACDALSELDFGTVAEHEAALTRRLLDGLGSVDGLEFLRLWSDAPDTVGIVTFTIDGFEPGEIAAYLSAEHGIGVRDGRFCAHPLLGRLGRPDGAVRVSVGLGSCSGDVDRLVDAVRTLVAGRRSWTYAKESGQWNPVPETRFSRDALV